MITQLLWDRYGPVWRRIVEEAGAEVRFAEPERVRSALRDERLRAIPSTTLRLAAAQALALHDCDLLVAPDLNPGAESARGGGQDPWIASFPEALGTLGGLPPIEAVPAELRPDLEGRVVEMAQRVSRDPGAVRRAVDRHRAELRPVRVPEPRWTLRPSELATVGVVGQPWLLSDALVAASAREGEHLVSQHRLDPRALRDEGTRYDARLVPTDAEAIGAARLFTRRGSVARLRVLVDREAGADAWLVRQIEKLAHKAVEVVALDELVPADDLPGSLLVDA